VANARTQKGGEIESIKVNGYGHEEASARRLGFGAAASARRESKPWHR